MSTQYATTASEPTETAPLLQGAQSSGGSTLPIGSEPGSQPSPDRETGWTKDAARVATSATVYLVLYAVADVARYIAVVRLLELGIRREEYLKDRADVVGNDGFIPEHLCKCPEIQERLARLRGYLASLDAIVGLLLTLPYGLVVDRFGERMIAGLSVVGYMLSCAWLAMVCYCWNVFPIWDAVLSPLIRVIGGGVPTYTSVIYALTAKHVPAQNRSLVFFIFTGGQIVGTILSILIMAWFLDQELLFAPLLFSLPLGLLCLVSLALMRPKVAAKEVCHDEIDEDRNTTSIKGTLRYSGGIIKQLFKDGRVLILLVAVPLAKLNTPMTELTLQYIPEKFDMSVAAVSRVISIKAFESLILMVVILPVIQKVAQFKFHMSSFEMDLYITQYSFLIQCVGCFLMAFAQTFYLFILGTLRLLFPFAFLYMKRIVLT
ncbi:major facilitator superfamily transporter [Apiospora kogelbergensis]|uniref:major facilitator superfamily transporter n=1 Tax=Apiospora kogelbergensis TaxID=1337665 RepID=UPI003130FF67